VNWIDFLIAVVASIAANLLTPSVRSFLVRAGVSAVAAMQLSGQKFAAIRLRQLQEERSFIESLHERPITLANRIASITAAQVFTLWLISGMLLFFTLNGLATNSAWASAIFGVIGYATRYLFGMLVALSDLRKVNDIATFRSQNDSAQARTSAILRHFSES
jgi:hypothetical protein